MCGKNARDEIVDQDIDTSQKKCRDNWIVKNWLTAIPLVGGFFKSPDLEKAFHHMGHSVFMLAGGALLMSFEPFKTSMDDSPTLMQAKMTSNMVIGMMAGEMAWNTIYSGGKAAVVSCKSRCKQEPSALDYQGMP